MRSHKKSRPNPLVLPPEYVPKAWALDEELIEMVFDQALLYVLRTSGIRDALLNRIRNAPPKKDEEKTDTIQ